MLEYDILETKPEIEITINGVTERIKDLLGETYSRNIEYLNGSPIMVNEHYIARPDLISLALYKDDKYADILCKINGISNPFELNEDMLLFCPTQDLLHELIERGVSKSEVVKNSKSETISKEDKTSLQKRADERRSPGEQVIGENNYIIDKSLGIVIY